MANGRTDIIIPQEIKENYEYIKRIVEDSRYSIDWSQVLGMLNERIRQDSPKIPFLTEEYIDCLMYAACFYNNFDLVGWLINNDADVDFQELESGNTLLHLAAFNGNVKLAELLITRGAHLNYSECDIRPNWQGNTYLHLAAEYGHEGFIYFITQKIAIDSMGFDSANLLLDYKNKEGNTLLHLAAKNGHIKCIEQILPYSNKNKKSSLVYTYCLNFFLATIISWLAIFPLSYFLLFTIPEKDSLLERIEDHYRKLIFLSEFFIAFVLFFCLFNSIKSEVPIGKINNDRETLLHLAIKSIQQANDEDQHFQCAKLLIEEALHSEINAQDKEGKTALCLAAEKGLVESVKLLLENKADAEVLTNSKKTALQLAIENSNYECAMFLIKSLIRVESKQRKWKLKLHKLYSVVSGKYCYIKSRITNLRLKIKKKIWFKENLHKEELYLAIEQQFKDNLGNVLWPAKRDIISELLKIIDTSDIDEVYNYAKSYAKKKGVQDGEYVLRTFDNFFRTHEKYKDKNLSKLKKQKSWYEHHILRYSNISLTILAILSLLKQNFNLSKNSDFVTVHNTADTIANCIIILAFLLSVRLHLKCKEFSKIKNFKDKTKEIAELLAKKKEKNIETQDGSPYGVADMTKQQRWGSFSKSKLAIFKQRKVYSSNNLELIPLLPSRLIETRRSLPNEVSELEQVFQTAIKQPSILNKKSTSNLKCKKTSNIKLIKNPSFHSRETKL